MITFPKYPIRSTFTLPCLSSLPITYLVHRTSLPCLPSLPITYPAHTPPYLAYPAYLSPTLHTHLPTLPPQPTYHLRCTSTSFPICLPITYTVHAPPSQFASPAYLSPTLYSHLLPNLPPKSTYHLHCTHTFSLLCKSIKSCIKYISFQQCFELSIKFYFL